MSITGSMPLLMATFCVLGSVAQAGLGRSSLSCGDCCTSQCCPSDYCCQSETKSEKVTRHCYETECKSVVIPPVKLPCCKCTLKKMFGRGCCDCGDAGCSDGGGSTGCNNGSGNGCSGGVLKNLCSKLTKCRIRCVSIYKKKDYDCGTKCVTKWKAAPRCDSGCGTACSDSDGCGTRCYCAPECCASVLYNQ